MRESQLVSVIIPVFNVAPYLAEALESVLSQTYKNLEIIVVDDGSTDGSGAICDEYATRDQRIVLIHQDNRGLSAARNVGLDHATGEVITFLDPDDAFHPAMVKTMLEGLTQASADIAICEFTIQKTTGQLLNESLCEFNPHWRAIDQDDAFQIILDGRMESAVWNKAYVRDVWKGLRFPEGYVYEGTYCVFEIFDRAHRIAWTNERLILHRNRPGSICNTHSLKNALDHEYAAKHFLAFVETHTPDRFTYGQLAQHRNRVFRGIVGNCLGYICDNPNDSEGIQLILESLRRTSSEPPFRSIGILSKAVIRLTNTLPWLSAALYRPYKQLKLMVRKPEIRAIYTSLICKSPSL